jgi:hypothetical protein
MLQKVLAGFGILLNAFLLGSNLSAVGVGTGAHEGVHCWAYHHLQGGVDECTTVILAPGQETPEGWDAYYNADQAMPSGSHLLVYPLQGLAILGTLLPGFALQAPLVLGMRKPEA